MKTIIVKAYTALNFGDDLFLKILLERFPDTRFLLLAPYKKYKKWEQIYNNLQIINSYFTLLDRFVLRIIALFKNDKYINIFIRQKYKIVHSLKDTVDAYLYIGGSLFQQNSSGGISLNDKINMFMTTVFSNKPKYILGANFGPFTEQEYVNYYKNIFSQYTDICFRDSYSCNLFKDIPSVRYEKDIVFCLNQLNDIEKEKNSVGFSLIGLQYLPAMCQYENVYIKMITQLIINLLSDNKLIYVFSFCKYGGDEIIIKKVIKKLSPQYRDKVKIIKYDGNINKFLSEYMKMEAVFTTRFHAMILSIIAHQYVYPLIYSNKMLHVIKDLGVDIKYSSIDNPDTAENMLKDLYSNKICLPLSSVKSSAEMQFLKMANFINTK